MTKFQVLPSKTQKSLNISRPNLVLEVFKLLTGFKVHVTQVKQVMKICWLLCFVDHLRIETQRYLDVPGQSICKWRMYDLVVSKYIKQFPYNKHWNLIFQQE